MKATFDSVNKAIDRIGKDETQKIVDAITERLDRRRELGGTGAKRTAAPTDKPKE